jgi:hypothetical protein
MQCIVTVTYATGMYWYQSKIISEKYICNSGWPSAGHAYFSKRKMIRELKVWETLLQAIKCCKRSTNISIRKTASFYCLIYT